MHGGEKKYNWCRYIVWKFETENLVLPNKCCAHALVIMPYHSVFIMHVCEQVPAGISDRRLSGRSRSRVKWRYWSALCRSVISLNLQKRSTTSHGTMRERALRSQSWSTASCSRKHKCGSSTSPCSSKENTPVWSGMNGLFFWVILYVYQ